MASPKTVVQEPKMSVLKSKDIAKPSLTNYYQVNVSGIPPEVKKYIAKTYGVPSNWISEQAGLMCADATLPTSSFATAEVKDNFHGINQQFAHTRLYIDSDFTFYVDKNYQMIKVFEGWMDYISGNNKQKFGQTDPRYYRRFNYPEGDKGYKCRSGFTITKFERDTTKTGSPMLSYEFFNVFPKSMAAIPVSYGPADTLKVTVSFAYDRYLILQGRGVGSGSDGPNGQGVTPVNPDPDPDLDAPINPVTGERIKNPIKGSLLTNKEYYDAYASGTVQSTIKIDAARDRKLSQEVRGPRGL